MYATGWANGSAVTSKLPPMISVRWIVLPACYTLTAVGGKGGKPGQAGRQAAAARAAAKRRQQRSGVVGAARLPDVSGESKTPGHACAAHCQSTYTVLSVTS
jgi:hypothetical protein